jgi:hypothetical protein
MEGMLGMPGGLGAMTSPVVNPSVFAMRQPGVEAFAHYGIASGSFVTRTVSGPYDTTVNIKDANRRLRIVGMEFPTFYAEPGKKGDITAATDIPAVKIWFSGSRSDKGENMSNSRTIQLLFDKVTKQPLTDKSHPAFRNDEAWTCASCHGRRDTGVIDPVLEKLPPAPSMQFRHIGYGDGGNSDGSCNPRWGLPRANLQPSLSTYLMSIANAFDVNGYRREYSRPVNPLPFNFCEGMSSCTTKLDPLRCIIFSVPTAN